MLKRLMKGVGANIFAQIVVVVTQIALVPIMATKWGLQNYGAWLLMATVPSYLALGDFGFGTAAGNDMTMKVARGDEQAALQTFQSAWLAIMGFSTAVIVTAIGIIVLIPNDILHNAFTIDGQEARLTLISLVTYGLVCLQGSILSAGFKSSGNYAVGTSLGAMTMLIDGAVAAGMVLSGVHLHEVAFAQLASRLLSLAVQAVILLRVAPWLSFGLKHANRSEIKRLWKPAAAVMLLPVAQSIMLQGSTMVVGMMASPAMVPAFVAVRTLTRFGVQIVSLLNHAIMPELSRLTALGDHGATKNVVASTLAMSVIVTLPMFIGLLLLGPYVINLWTHGVIKPPYALIVVMAMVMVLNTTWHPLSNLLLAVNHHAQYSYRFLICVCVTTVLAMPLCKIYGSVGVGVSILMLDAYMLLHVLRMIRLHLLNGALSIQEIYFIVKNHIDKLSLRIRVRS